MKRIVTIAVTTIVAGLIAAAPATAIPVPPDGAGRCEAPTAAASALEVHQDHPGAEHRMPYLFRVGSDIPL